MKKISSHPSSFRDPAGFIFEHEGTIYRQINRAGKDDYEYLMSSGLYKELTDKNLMVAHNETGSIKGLAADPVRYKIIKPRRIPFVSYPYEWTFSQTKAAALLTLEVQKLALSRGMILKDASAYNIQFVGKRPVFIDTLSFRIYEEGRPWEGYRQFCEHFVTSLALSVYKTPDILRTLRVFLDGIPLTTATDILSGRGRLKRGLTSHLYLHTASVRRYETSAKAGAAKDRKISRMALNGLMASLERTINRLKLSKSKTQWGQYYDETNYSKAGFKNKQAIVEQMLNKIKPTPLTVWDMGANDGTFSKLAAELGAYTVAFDIDHNAVEHNYHDSDNADKILPLLQDLSNPSPGLGWAHAERLSLEQRGPADVVMALALVHHLAITNHSPFDSIAGFFARISKNLIIEFVPKSDSKVKILLATTRNPYNDYDQEHFEAAFARYFETIQKKPVKDSQRTIYLYKAKG